MPAGLQIFNQGGFYQIDSEYKNFRLTGKQTIALPGVAASPPELFPGTVSTFITGNTPIVAIRSTVFCSIAMVRTGLPTNFQVRLASQDPGSATIYIFDQSPPVATGAGLQVFDGSGNQVYDANDKSLRVLDYYKQGNVFPGAVSSRSYSGKVAAVVVGGMLRYMQGSGPPTLQWEHLLGARTPSNELVERSFFIYRRYLTGTAVGYVSTRNVTDLVVNVAGY
jgi:hypothetical protein